jgi:inorganic pyrophosphatase
MEPLICVVEIPKGGRNKYEYDPELGASSSIAC